MAAGAGRLGWEGQSRSAIRDGTLEDSGGHRGNSLALVQTKVDGRDQEHI